MKYIKVQASKTNGAEAAEARGWEVSCHQLRLPEGTGFLSAVKSSREATEPNKGKGVLVSNEEDDHSAVVQEWAEF